MQSTGIRNNNKISGKTPRNPTRSTQTKTQSEITKLQKLTKDAIPDAVRDVAMPLIHNIAWQKVKLDEARHDLMNESLFCDYDNGGGQTGIREHPGFVAYNKLFATFSRGIKQLTDLMEIDAGEVDELQEYFNESRIA